MDNLVLYGPNGSSINVGSFLLYDPGADFGEADLLKAAYAENPAAEGGVLAFETVNIRRMSFPLRLASVGAFGGVNGLQSWLRTLARPGATLDVQLEGVPSSEAIRFDVAAGRLEADYEPRQYGQGDRLPATLKLDTQPFGYWPTMILLASAASIGGPGVLTLGGAGGSIFGDVPGVVELFIAPTTATSYGSVQKTDSIYWSLGAASGFQAWWVAASTLGVGSKLTYTPTLTGDQFAPASQSLRYWLASSAGAGLQNDGWQALAGWALSPALEPAYRGRFRAYAWAKVSPSQVLPVFASLDVQAGTLVSQALASAAPIATLPPITNGDFPAASPAYSLLDLGEITLPAIASSPYDTLIRLWFKTATTNIGVAATAQLDIGGLYLQPLQAPAGVLPRGLLQPTWTSPSALGRFMISGVTKDVMVGSPTSVVGSFGALAHAGQHHRGVLPYVGASTIQLDLNIAGKQAQAGAPTGQPPLRSEPHFAQVSVRYRPRFAFMKGI